jgi:hypothetical protein
LPTLDYEIPPGRATFDRIARDEVASTLASYLRGEIDNLEFHQRLHALETVDHTVSDIRFGLWFVYDDFVSHPVSVSREGWDQLRRTVAFLRSDLVFSRVTDSKASERSKSSRVRGIAVLSAMIVAGFIAWKMTWLGLLLPGLVEGPLVLMDMWRDRRKPSRDDQPMKATFFPFDCERDWIAHAHLLESDRLPDYDPDLHDQPIRPKANRLWLGMRSIPAYGLFLFAIDPLFLVMQLWPHGRDEHE